MSMKSEQKKEKRQMYSFYNTHKHLRAKSAFQKLAFKAKEWMS